MKRMVSYLRTTQDGTRRSGFKSDLHKIVKMLLSQGLGIFDGVPTCKAGE